MGTEDEEEYSLIEAIFGTNAKLDYERFLECMTKHAKWGFNPEEIRKVTFEKAAEIQMKHIK